jgi:hypothetical protein
MEGLAVSSRGAVDELAHQKHAFKLRLSITPTPRDPFRDDAQQDWSSEGPVFCRLTDFRAADGA